MDRLFLNPPNWQAVTLAVLVAAAVALVLAEAGARLVRLVIRRAIGRDASVTLKAPIVRTPIRLVRLTLSILFLVALTPPALEFAGQPLRRGLRLEQVTAWAMTGGLRLLLIAAVAFVLVRIIGLLVSRFEQEVSQGTDLEVLERAKRARTLGGLIRHVLTIVVVAIAGLMILSEFDVNITPVLTGAGIIGLAVGFGAQALVKDVITGFFMILENQIRVGDVVNIDGHGGFVEQVNVRTVVLRDLEGTLHIIPNGSISAVKNMTKDFSYYVIDMPAAYDADTDVVVDVVRKVGASLREDAQFAPFILDDLEVLGVDGFADSSVTIKIRIKTMPLKQWEVGRELRRRLKKAYDENGVEFPFPTRTVHMISPPEGS